MEKHKWGIILHSAIEQECMWWHISDTSIVQTARQTRKTIQDFIRRFVNYLWGLEEGKHFGSVLETMGVKVLSETFCLKLESRSFSVPAQYVRWFQSAWHLHIELGCLHFCSRTKLDCMVSSVSDSIIRNSRPRSRCRLHETRRNNDKQIKPQLSK